MNFGVGPSFRMLSLALCALALAATVTACGSAATSSGGTASFNSPARTQARLNLAKCMRSNGINVPDPSSGGGPAGGGGGIFRTLQNVPRTKLQAAFKACQQYVAAAFPRISLTPAQRQQARQQLVKFAECMRSHGVNIPDPTFSNNGGPGLGFGIEGAFRGAARNNPAFKAASQACASLRPRFGRGGGPGGAPGGAPSA